MGKKGHPKRLAPTKAVLRALFTRSGNRCAFPGCSNTLIDDDNNFVGQLCHIEAAMPKGQRFNMNQTDEQRRAETNLLLLCYPHHIKTNNVRKFDVQALIEMKRNHEASVQAFTAPENVINVVYNDQLQKISQAIDQLSIKLQAHDERQDQQFSRIYDMLQRIDSNTTPEIDLLPELQAVKELSSKNRPSSALSIINSTKQTRWEHASDKTKQKILTSEALLKLQLHDMQGGACGLIEAMRYNKNDDNTLALASLGYAILGDKKKANKLLLRALKKNSENVNAYNTLIQLNTLDFHELIKQIPFTVQDNPVIAYNLGFVAQQQGYSTESIELYQAAFEGDKTNGQFSGSLGSAIVESVSSDAFDYVTGQLSNDIKGKLRYAVEMIDHAWDQFAGTELEKQNVWLLSNRAIAKRMLGDYDGALEDALKVARLAPDSYALKHLVMTYSSVNNLQKALEVCERYIESQDNEFDARLLEADILFRMRNYAGSLKAIEKVEQMSISPIDSRAVWDFKVKCLIKIGKSEEAQKYIEELLKKRPNDPGPYAQAATFYLFLNDEEKARQQLIQGVKFVDSSTPKAELYEFAELCFNVRLFDKAAEIYRRITNIKVLSFPTKQLVRSLFNSGRRKDALNICLNLQETYGLDSFIIEALSMIYESIDDLKSAIEINEKYLAINPDDQVVLLRLAFIFNRQADKPKLAETLKKISKIDLTLPHEHGYKLALIYYQSGDVSKSLELAYETRRAHFNNGNAHTQYFGYYNEIKPNLPLPEIVAIHTTVQLIDQNGKVIIYSLEDRTDVLAERGELHVSDSIAIQLLGKKVGDFITVNKPIIGSSITLTIQSILSRYLYAYHQSIEFFQSRFIQESEITIINHAANSSPQERLTPIFRALDERESARAKLNEYYRKGLATIGTLSSILKINPIRTFYIQAGDPTLGILASWDPQELALVKNRLEEGSVVVLDITSLITFAGTQSLSILEKLSNKKITSQTTFDVISDLLRELSMVSEGHMTIAKSQGKYFSQEVTGDQVKQNITHYQHLQDWIKQHCEIKPANETLEMDRKMLLERDHLIGESFHDSILIAHELNGILVSEDSVLRRIAAGEYQVSGLHGFLLSFYVRHNGIIAQDELASFTLRLFEFNFKGIPCDSKVLTEAAKKTSLKLVSPLTQVIEGLQSPYFDSRISTLVTAEFLSDLYTLPELVTDTTNRAVVVNALLESLFKRPIDLNILAQSLKIRFISLPKQFNEVAGLIEIFLKKEGLI